MNTPLEPEHLAQPARKTPASEERALLDSSDSFPAIALSEGRNPPSRSLFLQFWLAEILLLLAAPLLLHLLLRSHGIASPYLLALIWLVPLYSLLQRFWLHRLKERMTAESELFRIISENAADMIALVDVSGKRLYNSPAYTNLLGYSREELRTTSSFQQIHPDDREKVMAAAQQARQTGRGQKIEYRIRHKNGHWVFLESTASVVRNPQGAVQMLVIVNRDISERKRVEDQLKHNALHDSLTNLPNRKLFLDRLQRAWERCRRQNDYHFAVLFVDIDGFKVYNDTMGHAVGDDLIMQISARLSGCIRFEDMLSRPTGGAEEILERDGKVLARMGGDEFTILVGNIKEASDALRVANRIHDALGTLAVEGREVYVTASIGIALSTTPHTRAEEMLRNADIAMYRAKTLGKSRTEFFDPQMHTNAVHRLQLDRELRKAIEAHEFKVHYQPIVQLQSGLVSGFEALVRWDSDTGLKSPDYFISVAEETGLVIPMGEWVLREACRQLRAWHQHHPDQAGLSVTVNVSPKQFDNADLVQQIESALQETGIEPRLLHLEITESAAMGSTEKALNILERLKDIGVSVCLDDFGTGHSSLARLQRLPVDILKIDRSFVMHMHTDEDARKLVNFIIAVAHTLGIKVVAEGIETASHVGYLRELGCDFGQGYFFARPADSETAEALIVNGLANAAAATLSRAAKTGN